MPQRNRPRALNEQQQQHHHHQQQQVNSRHHHQQGRDPLAACLDADGTYICTAYNSRCYIIQKVTPNLCAASLNPDADIFQSKVKHPHVQSYQIFETDYTALEGSVYMNGDIGKLPSGAVYAATPETLAPSPNADFSSIINGVGDPTESLVSEGGAAPMGQAPAPLPPESSIPLPLDPNNPSMPIDQLKQMLSSQLEYYFSRENLANDAYLISQMDNDQYVPIWTVANFNQVKKLTTDIKLITEVLRESPNVQVDEEGQKVRPNHKRCIVILREIPDSTPLEEVKALFSGKGCPKLISCEFAHNNSWYVTFENDEDAQRAYRFLREEVKEFQGKPIMARIKAKPMSRLPMPPVTPGMGGMKNGYRTPPATAAAAAATATVYDPASTAAFPPGQQRFLYTNGTSLPPNVNYTNQVQIYTFQQHQPFYPPSMLPHWGATTPTYFDIGSVFSVNGLAPQGTFGKGHNTRFIPRNRNKRSSGLEQRASLSDSSLMRGSHTSHSVGPKLSGKIDSSGGGNSSTKSLYYSGADRGTREVVAHPTTQPPDASSCGGVGVATEGAVAAPLQPPPGPTSTRPQPSTTITPHDQDDLCGRTTAIAATTAQSSSLLVSSTKESLPPRHRRRRKEDDVQCCGGGSPGPQFDLEADAFPPLPVLEPAAQPLHLHHHNYQQPSASAVSVSGPGHSNQTVTKPLPLETPTTTTEPIPAQSATQWVESRLSDVVKGTAKMKMGSGIKDKDLVAVGGGNNTVSSSHGGPPTPSLPTPPNTPDKIVPGAANGKSSSMPSKLTKTDDTTAAAVVPVMNGSGEPAPTITASSTVMSGSNGIDNLRGESVVPVGGVPSDGAKQLPANVLLSSTVTTGVELPSTLNSNNSSTTPLQSQSELAAGVVRLSYAQVAQHHHKEKAEREKQQQSTVVSMAAVMSPAPATLHNMAPIALPEEEKKEITIHHTSKVVDSLSTRGRGGAARAAPRRRDNLPRFNSRQRSPK